MACLHLLPNLEAGKPLRSLTLKHHAGMGTHESFAEAMRLDSWRMLVQDGNRGDQAKQRCDAVAWG